MLWLLALGLVSSMTIEDRFEDFKVKFSRRYRNVEEEAWRFKLFNASWHRAQEYNKEHNGLATFGITKMSDRSDTEKQSMKCGGVIQRDQATKKKPDTWNGECAACVRFPDHPKAVPEDWDWREYGAVTRVKDQGMCGDCFTFGATGDIEGAWYLAGNDLVALSEQQLTSCDRVGGDAGCRGGMTDLDTFKYVIKTGGIVSEETYPQSAKTYNFGIAGKCDESKLGDWAASITGSMQISGNDYYPIDEDKTKSALYNLGPVTIAINSKYFDDYDSGIIHPKKCKNGLNSLDHQVLLTGYGVDNGTPYWTVKNSWADDWGEDGYIRIYRGDNVCGVVDDVTHCVV